MARTGLFLRLPNSLTFRANEIKFSPLSIAKLLVLKGF